MPEWLISLISVIVGSIIGITGTELLQWWKRPKFKIDFEEGEGRKPWTPDYNSDYTLAAGDINRTRYFRLAVRNIGKKPAMNCEAKIETSFDIENTITRVVTALHWSRRDPALYWKSGTSKLGFSENVSEKVFAPIDLNIDDQETVDVFRLPYHFSTLPRVNHTPQFINSIESVSLRPIVLQPNTTYNCKVTVYATNTNPESFTFQVSWDGTLEGFNKAFTVGKGDQS